MKYLTVLLLSFSLTGCLGDGGTTYIPNAPNAPTPSDRLVPDSSSAQEGSVLTFVAGVMKWVVPPPAPIPANLVVKKEWRLITNDKVVGTAGFTKNGGPGYVTDDGHFVYYSGGTLRDMETTFGNRYFASSNCSDSDDIIITSSTNIYGAIFASSLDPQAVYVFDLDVSSASYNSVGNILGQNCTAQSGTINTLVGRKSRDFPFNRTSTFQVKFQ